MIIMIKKNTYKLLIVVIAIMLLAGCGGTNNETTNNETDNITQSPQDTSEYILNLFNGENTSIENEEKIIQALPDIDWGTCYRLNYETEELLMDWLFNRAMETHDIKILTNFLRATKGLDGALAEGYGWDVAQLYSNDIRKFVSCLNKLQQNEIEQIHFYLLFEWSFLEDNDRNKIIDNTHKLLLLSDISEKEKEIINGLLEVLSTSQEYWEYETTATLKDENKNLITLKAEIGETIDISAEAEEEFNMGRELIDKDFEKLIPEQQEIVRKYCETKTSIWDTGTLGDSWYNAGGPNKMSASSFLSQDSEITYNPENIHDFDLRTAWAVKNGIGEYISIHFEPFFPRVNKIKIYNGYQKSEETWNNNSRVKKIKLYINDNPYAILELEDTRAVQEFSIEPVQSKTEEQDLVLRFEIIEVYKGNKFRDVVISEINFEGLDVLCFKSGTLIKMVDGSQKPIEQLKPNDKILSYNLNDNRVETSTILGLEKVIHNNLVILDFGNFQITSTDDHPYFVQDKGWSSINPLKTSYYNNMKNTQQLEIGDSVMLLSHNNKISTVKLLKIKKATIPEMTYTITKLDKNNSFFANGLLVGVEEINK